ncbi:hypothetical protein [Bradyrhizobium sp. I1.7.5]|uniref:hypothetical protein n=1 Tax=Bradyrhizobium sp. I1.7.5 TaxID=3156363 RepID=UPI00339283C4
MIGRASHLLAIGLCGMLVANPARAKELTEADKRLSVTTMLDALSEFRARSLNCGDDPEDARELAFFLAAKYGFAGPEAERYLARKVAVAKDLIPSSCDYKSVNSFRTSFLNSLGDFDYQRSLK